MAILNSNGIVTFSSVPVTAPTDGGPSFGRLVDTNTFYYYNGSAWVTVKIGDDTAYNATTWNANLDVATKNVIRDEFEAIRASLVSAATPLKYKVVLSQALTAAPTASIAINTLGEVPVNAYVGVGNYEFGTTGTPFTAKTIITATLDNGAAAETVKVEVTATNKISIFTYTAGVADELDGDLHLSIEIYP